MEKIKSFGELAEDSNYAGVEFLFTELASWALFLDVSETTTQAETRLRNHENAHLAYVTLLRYLPRVLLTEIQQFEFDAKLGILKERLQLVGFAL